MKKDAKAFKRCKTALKKDFLNTKQQCCIYWIKLKAISDINNFPIQLFDIDYFADDQTNAY